MVAVYCGRHCDALALRLHELQHAALAKHILKDHAIGTEREIAAAWLQFLPFRGVEMAEQRFVGNVSGFCIRGRTMARFCRIVA